MKKIIQKINENAILRNVILAICAVIVFLFLCSILLNIFTRHNSQCTVPDFSGMQLEQAIKVAGKESLRVEVSDSIYVTAYEGGVVLDQIPSPNTVVKPGRRVFLTVNSFEQKKVVVPYVTGFSLRQAKNNLEVAGLEIDKLIFQSDMASNYVLEQRFDGKKINKGSKLEINAGSGITLVVGMSGEGTNRMTPKLIGFPLKEAKSRLGDAGLNVGKIEYDDDINAITKINARVYIQLPDQGSRVAVGSTVNLKLTLDPQKITKGSSQSDKAAKNITTIQQIEDQLIQDNADKSEGSKK